MGQTTFYCIVTDGKVEYKLCSKLHRDNGPAVIKYKGGLIIYEEWYRNDRQHRNNGPAVIKYCNGILICELWYKYDKLHRDNGPPIVRYDRR